MSRDVSTLPAGPKLLGEAVTLAATSGREPWTRLQILAVVVYVIAAAFIVSTVTARATDGRHGWDLTRPQFTHEVVVAEPNGLRITFVESWLPRPDVTR